MIAAVIQTLTEILVENSPLIGNVEIDLNHPQTRHDVRPALSLYLYELTKSDHNYRGDRDCPLDTEHYIVGWYDLSFVIIPWDWKVLGQWQLLSEVLRSLLPHQLIVQDKSFAVNGFFLNGGGRCWICSVGTHLPGKQPPPEQSGLEIPTRGGNRPSLRFGFKNPRANLPPLTIEIQDSTPKALPPNTEGEPPENTGEFFSVVVKQGDRIVERFDNLTMNQEVNSQVADYVVNRVGQSQILQVADISQVGRPLARKPATGVFRLNLPQVVSRPENLTREMKGSQDDRTGVQGMFEIDEINILACPDLMKVYQEGLMSLDQVHDIMTLLAKAIYLFANTIQGGGVSEEDTTEVHP